MSLFLGDRHLGEGSKPFKVHKKFCLSQEKMIK